MGQKCTKIPKNVLKIHKIWPKIDLNKTYPKGIPKYYNNELKLAKSSPKCA